MSILRSLAVSSLLSTAVVGVSVGACSESDAPTEPTAAPASTAYRGLLSGVAESGVIDVVLASGSSKPNVIEPRDFAGAESVSGSISLLVGGQVVTLAGSYDPATGALTLSGSSPAGTYTLTGTSTPSGFEGTYSSPSGGGTFALAPAASGATTLICGSARSNAGEVVSAFNFIVGANSVVTGASCSKDGCNLLDGKVEGTRITLGARSSGGVGAEGTLVDGNASGTWTSSSKSGTWSGSSAACQSSSGPPVDAGDIDAGELDAGHDAGTDAAPSGATTLLTNVDEPVSMAIDDGHLYWVSAGGSAIEQCVLPACVASTTVAAGLSVPSSVAAARGTVFWTSDFRFVKSCATPSGGTCTGTTVTDVGASTFPAHLATTASHLYWISEVGPTRRIQTCPIAGCSEGYPKAVLVAETGSPLYGQPIAGFTTDGTTAYVAVFTGGIYRVALVTPEKADDSTLTHVQPSAFGTTELDLDGTTLRWGLQGDGKIVACTTPGCATVTDVASGLITPIGTRGNTTAIYGMNRGAAKQGGGYVARTGSVWRIAK